MNNQIFIFIIKYIGTTVQTKPNHDKPKKGKKQRCHEIRILFRNIWMKRLETSNILSFKNNFFGF